MVETPGGLSIYLKSRKREYSSIFFSQGEEIYLQSAIYTDVNDPKLYDFSTGERSTLITCTSAWDITVYTKRRTVIVAYPQQILIISLSTGYFQIASNAILITIKCTSHLIKFFQDVE